MICLWGFGGICCLMLHALLQASAFASWKEHIAFRQVKAAALAASIAKIRGSLVARAVASWRDVAGARRDLKRKATLVVARMRNAAMAQAFGSWHEWAVGKHSAR